MTRQERRLSRGRRRTWLVVHVVSVGAWIGIDVIVAVLVLTGWVRRTLFFPPAVSLTALTFATALAIFKPWGRIRAQRATPPRRQQAPVS